MEMFSRTLETPDFALKRARSGYMYVAAECYNLKQPS